MGAMIAKIRCKGCDGTKVIALWPATGEDEDVLEAAAGEFVERQCTACDAVTDHEVLTAAAYLPLSPTAQPATHSAGPLALPRAQFGPWTRTA